jgi:hypothetical protein
MIELTREEFLLLRECILYIFRYPPNGSTFIELNSLIELSGLVAKIGGRGVEAYRLIPENEWPLWALRTAENAPTRAFSCLCGGQVVVTGDRGACGICGASHELLQGRKKG